MIAMASALVTGLLGLKVPSAYHFMYHFELALEMYGK
jgi:hypothetical protein